MTNGGFAIANQNKHNTTINKCWSRVGAVITVTYGGRSMDGYKMDIQAI
jgi:hypothetical protein